MKNWEKSTNTRVAGLLSLVAAVNLLDKDEAEKQLKEGVEAFLKGNKAMIENLLSSHTNSILKELRDKILKIEVVGSSRTGVGGPKYDIKIYRDDVLFLIDAMVEEGKA